MDTMVTARMPARKKEIGNNVLKRLNTNPSAAINRFYDYLIENEELPFPTTPSLTPEEIQRRIAIVDSISLPAGNRFSTMSDDEIRRERLGLK